MSKILKDFLKTRFTRVLGGGSNKHRCQAPNPSTAKLHGPLPTQEELHAFEQSYAGSNTPELMERYSGWSSGLCPRTIHFDCIDKKAPHTWHKRHCPACVRRRWNLIRVITPVQRQGQSDEDYYMQRIRRYHRWHRYHCQHVEVWQSLFDNGSLESDRRLLIDMGVSKRKPVSTTTNNRGDGSHRESNPSDAQSEAVSDHTELHKSGEAAEYFDPNAPRLGTDAGSIRSNLSYHPAASRKTKNNQAAPVPSKASSSTSHPRKSASSHTGSLKPASIASRRSSNAEQIRGLPDHTELSTAPSVRSHASKNGSTSRAQRVDIGQERAAVSASRPPTNSQRNRKPTSFTEDAPPHEPDSRMSLEALEAGILTFVRSRNNIDAKLDGAKPAISHSSNQSKVSTTSTDSMQSHRSNDSRSNISRRSERSLPGSTEVSRVSTGATSDTSCHLDERSNTGKRPA